MKWGIHYQDNGKTNRRFKHFGNVEVRVLLEAGAKALHSQASASNRRNDLHSGEQLIHRHWQVVVLGKRGNSLVVVDCNQKCCNGGALGYSLFHFLGNNSHFCSRICGCALLQGNWILAGRSYGEESIVASCVEASTELPLDQSEDGKPLRQLKEIELTWRDKDTATITTKRITLITITTDPMGAHLWTYC